MPITTNCPSCSRTLRVPDELLGKNVKCPTCGTTFTATAEGPAPEEEEPAPAITRTPAPPADDEGQEEPGERRPRRRRREYTQPHRGTMILVLGILSACGVVPIVLGPIAWILGNNDLKEIRAGRMDPEGESTTNAGRICGMIGTLLWGVGGLLCCIVYVVFIAIIAASSPHGMH